jgi:Ca2+-binding RTX toxin-like protein
MRRAAIGAVLGFVLTVGAVPASAGLTTVERVGGFRVQVTDEETNADADRNTILVEEDSAGNLLVTDSGFQQRVAAGSGCFLQTATRVSCSPDPSNSSNLFIATGNDNDEVTINLPARPLSGVASTSVYGGPGNDGLIGHPGTDTLEGDARLGNGNPYTPSQQGGPQDGADRLTGGAGPDTLRGNGGRDYLNGASFSADDTNTNTLDGGADRDYFDAGRMLGADRFIGGSGGDGPITEDAGGTVLGFTTFLTNNELTQVWGGDTVSYGTRTYATAGTAGVIADLDGVRDDGATGENDQIDADVEALVGTIRDDRLTGSSVANRIEGKLGTDTLVGGDGADKMRFREGVPDRCFVPGTGDNVDLDLTDPPATICTPKTLPLSFSTTLNASPADETMPYVAVARRVRRTGARRVVAKVRCGRGSPKTCKGRVSLSRRLGSKRLARRPFRARAGRTARVTFKLSAARAAALKRSGRVVVTETHQGVSKVGPTTTIVARRVR